MSPKLQSINYLVNIHFTNVFFYSQHNAFIYSDSAIGFNARPFEESTGEYSQHIILLMKENWIAMQP